jgi:glycosyltransferase involved in cell wall biosynthesis
MSSVTVIIPARNADQTIGWTLAGLAEQDHEGDWEVIVVDDGSRDRTRKLALSSSPSVRVVGLDGRGAAQARNAGVAAGSGEALAFLDADCRPSRSWLRSGVAALASADLVQGATHPDPAAQVGPFDRTLSVRQPSALYESANLFVRRELFERIGGFQHWVGTGAGNRRPFGEDVSFGWQARRLGARIDFCDEALVYHAVFPRGMRGYVAERARLRYFPALAGDIPELREHFFYRRWFLTRRSAAYDLALAASLLAAASRNRLPLVALAPYFAQLAGRAGGGGARHACKMVLAELAADSVGFVALLIGTATSGSAVV